MSGGVRSTVQEQAEWLCRTAKAQSTPVVITVLGYRAGPDNALWRPNQLTSVWDPYSGIDRDMLVAGVTFRHDDKGQRTELRMVGPSAYDRINEAERRRRGKLTAAKQRLDSAVTPLTAQ